MSELKGRSESIFRNIVEREKRKGSSIVEQEVGKLVIESLAAYLADALQDIEGKSKQAILDIKQEEQLEYIRCFHDFSSVIPIENIETIVSVMMDIGDLLPQNGEGYPGGIISSFIGLLPIRRPPVIY